MSGTFTDAAGSRRLRITWQTGPRFRIEELGGRMRVLLFDGSTLKNTLGAIGDGERRLIETVAGALPEHIFWSAANGTLALRFLGGHFRASDDTSDAYTGPYSDLYALVPGSAPDSVYANAAEYLVSIDSDSLLIDKVSHSREDGTQVETRLGNWTEQGAQWFPATIARFENGAQTMQFQVASFQVNAASGISLFQN